MLAFSKGKVLGGHEFVFSNTFNSKAGEIKFEKNSKKFEERTKSTDNLGEKVTVESEVLLK